MDDVKVCAVCGESIPDGAAVELENGVYVCEDCDTRGVIKCISCGIYHYQEESTADCNGELVCESCRDNYGYSICERCGCWSEYANEITDIREIWCDTCCPMPRL